MYIITTPSIWAQHGTTIAIWQTHLVGNSNMKVDKILHVKVGTVPSPAMILAMIWSGGPSGSVLNFEVCQIRLCLPGTM